MSSGRCCSAFARAETHNSSVDGGSCGSDWFTTGLLLHYLQPGKCSDLSIFFNFGFFFNFSKI